MGRTVFLQTFSSFVIFLTFVVKICLFLWFQLGRLGALRGDKEIPHPFGRDWHQSKQAHQLTEVRLIEEQNRQERYCDPRRNQTGRRPGA